jgi:putative membrane protein
MFELAQHAGRVFGPGFGPAYHTWLGPLWTLLMIGLIVAGVIIVVRMLSSRQPPSERGSLQILEERFARGEIDEEEFRRRRDALRA